MRIGGAGTGAVCAVAALEHAAIAACRLSANLPAVAVEAGFRGRRVSVKHRAGNGTREEPGKNPKFQRAPALAAGATVGRSVRRWSALEQWTGGARP